MSKHPHTKDTLSKGVSTSDLGVEDKLATTNAQLIVNLGSCANIPVSDPSLFLGLYCIITFDKQQVRSDNSLAKSTCVEGKDHLSADWTELVKFDVTQALEDSFLSVSIWGKNNESTASLGTARIPLSGLELGTINPITTNIRLSKEKKFIPSSSGSPVVGASVNRTAGKSPSLSGNHPHHTSHNTANNANLLSSSQSSSNTSLPGFDNSQGNSQGKAALSDSSNSNLTLSGSNNSFVSNATLSMTISIEKQKTKVSENDFEKLRVIGRGTFGKVFQARKKDTGRIYAMKVLKKDHVVKHNAVKHTMSENHVLKNINHPFIVNLKYAFQTSSHLYMVIDYLNGGELFYHLTHDDYFPEARARFYAAEVVSALGYLHDHHILYRDLKPENLLLDMHGHVCLVDFGLCKVGWSAESKTHTFCGSAEYLAPELLRGKGYGKEVDWWALGTLIYEMLSGLPPYWDEDEEYMQKKIMTAPLKLHKYFSAEVKDLLKSLLNRDPAQRIGTGIRGTEMIKSHPWFAGIDWAALDRREEVPPFVPHLKNEQDLPYVEEEVLRELPALSLTTHSLHLDQDLFAGFSYDSEALPKLMQSMLPQAPARVSRSARRDSLSKASPGRVRSGSAYSSDSGDDSNSGTSRTGTPGSGKISGLGNRSSSGTLPSSSSNTKQPKGDSDLIFSLEESS